MKHAIFVVQILAAMAFWLDKPQAQPSTPNWPQYRFFMRHFDLNDSGMRECEKIRDNQLLPMRPRNIGTFVGSCERDSYHGRVVLYFDLFVAPNQFGVFSFIGSKNCGKEIPASGFLVNRNERGEWIAVKEDHTTPTLTVNLCGEAKNSVGSIIEFVVPGTRYDRYTRFLRLFKWNEPTKCDELVRRHMSYFQRLYRGDTQGLDGRIPLEDTILLAPTAEIPAFAQLRCHRDPEARPNETFALVADVFVSSYDAGSPTFLSQNTSCNSELRYQFGTGELRIHPPGGHADFQLSCQSESGDNDDLGVMATLIRCDGENCVGRRATTTLFDGTFVSAENIGASAIMGQNVFRFTFDRAVRADQLLLVCDGGLTMPVRQHSPRAVEATFFAGLNCKMAVRGSFVPAP